ncbi:hypothetical protein SS37A_06170 [Methylocystis iwaonis]|uniref:Uncharacterized protein n=1 Tax=Methylocystis iwaonis TaxID=2885079 RepID=A0ABM8E5A1_9HYPH|nr:hypothetical protein SS37A_06170 [Methylocystis iwaonis]
MKIPGNKGPGPAQGQRRASRLRMAICDGKARGNDFETRRDESARAHRVERRQPQNKVIPVIRRQPAGSGCGRQRRRDERTKIAERRFDARAVGGHDNSAGARRDLEPIGAHAFIKAEIAGPKARDAVALRDAAFPRENEGKQGRLRRRASDTLCRAIQALERRVDKGERPVLKWMNRHRAREGLADRRVARSAHVDIDEMVADGVPPPPQPLLQRKARQIEA